METPTPLRSNPTGFSASSARVPLFAWFRPRSDLPDQTCNLPNLVVCDLEHVQPMNGPTGLIFAIGSRLNNQSGDETFFDEVDTAFSGQDLVST